MKHEHEARRAAPLPDREGPTDPVIEIIFHEVAAGMPLRDRQKLLLVSPYAAGMAGGSDGCITAARAIPGRTLRRWRLKLFQEYGSLVRSG
jgi:hypothetical protein